MMNRWDDIVTLAREIEHARSIGATIDPEKTRQLASLVLTLENDPPRAQSGSTTRDERTSSP